MPVFPAALSRHCRAIMQAALDHPQPVEPGGRQRPGEYISIGSFTNLAADVKAFAIWLDAHGISDFREVTDVVLDLIEDFQARVRAQGHTPLVAQALAEQISELKEKLAGTATALAAERATTAILRKIVAELDLELHAARDGSGPVPIASLPARRRRPASGS
ncbi:hypothetical protein [Streptomyces sp. R41]|uniref:Uncharacterized protein n=1 Tax=Streptomyces sp. R41 TaxID=3238632 RepID=A0AB39R9P0_9ACTN